MITSITRSLPIAALLICVLGAPAFGQTPATPPSNSEPSPAANRSGFAALRGRWVRPDGGYVITIRGADADGRLDAAYANPNPLPFAKAVASDVDGTLQLFFELRAGGYEGSTYTLRYDPAKDVLHGFYYQAVAHQSFDVSFTRER